MQVKIGTKLLCKKDFYWEEMGYVYSVKSGEVCEIMEHVYGSVRVSNKTNENLVRFYIKGKSDEAVHVLWEHFYTDEERCNRIRNVATSFCSK